MTSSHGSAGRGDEDGRSSSFRLQVASERIALIQAFAAQLVALRQAAGLSASELAERCHVSPGVIEKAERARAEPRLVLILALCEGLRIAPNDLLSGLRPPKRHSNDHTR